MRLLSRRHLGNVDSSKEKRIWVIRGKKIKARRNSRRRASLVRRKNERRRKKRRTNKCPVLSGDLCVLSTGCWCSTASWRNDWHAWWGQRTVGGGGTSPPLNFWCHICPLDWDTQPLARLALSPFGKNNAVAMADQRQGGRSSFLPRKEEPVAADPAGATTDVCFHVESLATPDAASREPLNDANGTALDGSEISSGQVSRIE